MPPDRLSYRLPAEDGWLRTLTWVSECGTHYLRPKEAAILEKH
jgi:hypothetical protein